jgi:hypothetical protein
MNGGLFFTGFIVEKDPVRGRIIVVVLPVFDGPYKGDQKKDGYGEAGAQQHDDHTHLLKFL